jgi:hypothetical protein
MDFLTLNANWFDLTIRLERITSGDKDVPLARSDPKATTFVAKTIGGNSEKPDRPRAEQALRAQEIVELRVCLFEL